MGDGYSDGFSKVVRERTPEPRWWDPEKWLRSVGDDTVLAWCRAAANELKRRRTHTIAAEQHRAREQAYEQELAVLDARLREKHGLGAKP